MKQWKAKNNEAARKYTVVGERDAMQMQTFVDLNKRLPDPQADISPFTFTFNENMNTEAELKLEAEA
jgi:hypothetical protein